MLSEHIQIYPIVHVNGKPAWYIDQPLTRVKIPNGNNKAFIDDENQFGALLAFEAHYDRMDAGLIVELNSQNNAKTIINNSTIRDLLRLGRGLTPGDIQDIAGISPDPAGKPLLHFPYVARAKNTTETDVISDFGRGFVIRYEPANPLEYSGIKITFNNPSGSSALLIKANIKRAVFLTESEIERMNRRRR